MTDLEKELKTRGERENRDQSELEEKISFGNTNDWIKVKKKNKRHRNMENKSRMQMHKSKSTCYSNKEKIQVRMTQRLEEEAAKIVIRNSAHNLKIETV